MKDKICSITTTGYIIACTEPKQVSDILLSLMVNKKYVKNDCDHICHENNCKKDINCVTYEHKLIFDNIPIIFTGDVTKDQPYNISLYISKIINPTHSIRSFKHTPDPILVMIYDKTKLDEKIMVSLDVCNKQLINNNYCISNTFTSDKTLNNLEVVLSGTITLYSYNKEICDGFTVNCFITITKG